MNCRECDQFLVIGLTAELHPNGTDRPDVLCSDCGEINPQETAIYLDDSAEEPGDDLDVPGTWGNFFRTLLR